MTPFLSIPSTRDRLARLCSADQIDWLTEEIRTAVASCQARWPLAALADDVLADFVISQLEGRGDAPVDGKALHLDDLLFIRVCHAGDHLALDEFIARYRKDIALAARRISGIEANEQDLFSDLYEKLFRADEERGPRIFGYRGQGELATWLRVVAARAAIDFARRKNRERDLSESILEHMATCGDAESAYASRVCKAEIKAAFQFAVAELEPAQRNVLRYSYLDNLSAEEVGRMLQVHRVTVAKWLGEIRATLSKSVRRKLKAELKLRDDELSGILNAVETELTLSLSRIL